MSELLIRKCKKCNQDKELNYFYLYNKNVCKSCIRKHEKQWRKDNRDKVNLRTREYRKENKANFYFAAVKQNYGITKEEYWELFYLQNKCCAICKGKGKEGKKRGSPYLCIDHDHCTGKIRGLLCNHCNSTLGFARDSKEVLRECISYLDKHNTFVPNYSI